MHPPPHCLAILLAYLNKASFRLLTLIPRGQEAFEREKLMDILSRREDEIRKPTTLGRWA
jgi:hypothetical protein